MKHLKRFNENITEDDLREDDKRMGVGIKLSPEDREYTFDDKGRRLTRYKNRLYDEVIPPNQANRNYFIKLTGQVKYEIGDVIRLRDGYKVKNVTITDIEETPYKNVAGGNAFTPHSYKYFFVEN